MSPAEGTAVTPLNAPHATPLSVGSLETKPSLKFLFIAYFPHLI